MHRQLQINRWDNAWAPSWIGLGIYQSSSPQRRRVRFQWAGEELAEFPILVEAWGKRFR